jgi:hypothetical protein
MGIVLLYGLKTDDLGYLKEFYPSRRIAEAASSLGLDYAALLYPPESPFEPILAACQGRQALLRGELPMALYEDPGSRRRTGSKQRGERGPCPETNTAPPPSFPRSALPTRVP